MAAPRKTPAKTPAKKATAPRRTTASAASQPKATSSSSARTTKKAAKKSLTLTPGQVEGKKKAAATRAAKKAAAAPKNVTGIKHTGPGGCGDVSGAPDGILQALTEGTWESGLDCVRCQAYRPLEDFELVRG